MSHTFSAPLGETMLYAMTSSGNTISFGTGSVLGVLLGAFAGSLFNLHSPSGVSFEVKIACIRALDKDFLPQAAPAVAQTAGSGRIRPRSRCFLAQGRRFSAQRTDLSSRFRSV
ncbi:hypothetical protein ACFQFQ_17520 [Sulfitobacter porphyrae]|uniref:Uncharacterized protein n=2 Tax=Alphaproteobacteria TaxID=28211 RepID=A0ABW2B5M4_9RHOB